MRYSKDHKQATRQRILEAAGRRFKEDGIDGAGVATVMAEAGLTAGLTAVGVPPSAAMAAALVHRMATYYLPPVWGWFALRWLGRRGYV